MTVHLSPRLALPASKKKTDAHVPGQCGNQGLLKITSTTRAALLQAPHTRNTPLTPAIPIGSIARVLVSSVLSLPKRKVMAFASWIRCVFRPNLRASIRSHFSRVPCPVKKRYHPVSITRLAKCYLTRCGLLRSRQTMTSSPLHPSLGTCFPLFKHSRAQCPSSRQRRQRVREISSLILSLSSTR